MSKIGLVPLSDRVVVLREEPEGKSKGGIILPDNAKERPQRGQVVAIGDGRQKEDGDFAPMYLAVGDRVVFGAYTGNEVEVDGVKYLVMNQGDVLAKLT